MKTNHCRRTYRRAVWLLVCLSVLFSSAFATALAEEAACSHGKASKDVCDICKFENYEVETKHPDLVKLNLFDYWLTSNRWDADTAANDSLTGKGWKDGINYNHDANRPHLLHFRTGDYTALTPESESVPFSSVPAGLVQAKLGPDGYPVAVKKPQPANMNNTAKSVHNSMPATESLAYLFDPSIAHTGKASFSDVRGLFLQDTDGYYYYNSMEEGTHTNRTDDVEYVRYGNAYKTANYAYFDETEHRFRVYNNFGVYLRKRTANSSDTGSNWGSFNMHGQFYPFDPPSEVFELNTDGTPKIDGAGKLIAPDRNCADAMFNHYMGFSLEVPFVQTTNGKMRFTDNHDEVDTIFYFSGDDDMWLFIDGVLVGDLGGIHDAFTMEINFAKGTVKLNANHEDTNVRRSYTLKELFTNAGVAKVDELFKDVTVDGQPYSIFQDGSQHVIKMFYMERGHNASNLGIKFNLQTQLTSSLHKQDQDGNIVPGAEFSIYEATKDPVTHEYTQTKNTPVFVGTTNEEGQFFLINSAGHAISIGGENSVFSGSNHFIMRETVVPDGYRRTGEMHLMKYTLNDGSVTLLSDPDSPTGSKWNTGSYGAATLLTRAPLGGTVSLRTGEKVVENNSLIHGGTMFAVVLKRVKFGNADLTSQYTWRPVYGTPKDGYTLVDIAEETEDAYAQAIKTAIKNNPYQFKIGSTGRYEVHVENLPGDILHYLNARPAEAGTDNVQYAVFYGWTDANSLRAEDLNKATRFVRLNSDNFSRQFAVNFMALNVKETFNVKKTDENGEALEGVEFALYKADKETIHDSAVTDGNGMITFPTPNGAPLAAGHYYLAETAVPEGYEMRTDLVHIYVDDTGVYADAGRKGDGVTVQRGVGRIVDTMHEFGVNDDLDVTLHNIYYNPYITTDEPGANGFENAKWTKQSTAYHLHHRPHDEAHPEHGFEPAAHSDLSDAHFVNDEGWSHISIYQCREFCCVEVDNYPYPHKEDLGDRDITNLFTRGVTVIVANEKKRAEVVIEGTKTFHGFALKDGEFTFKVTPIDNAPKPIEPFAVNKADGSITFAPIPFAYGTHISNGATNEPVTYQYRIEEVPTNALYVVFDPTYWIAKVTVTYDDQTEKMNASVTYAHYDQTGQLIDKAGTFDRVSFVNAYLPPATGDDSSLLLWSAALAACMGCALLLMRRRREN